VLFSIFPRRPGVADRHDEHPLPGGRQPQKMSPEIDRLFRPTNRSRISAALSGLSADSGGSTIR
jgi:hypothetical protein